MADQISIVTDQPTTDSGSPITAAVNFRTRSTSSASVPSSIRYRVDCLTTKRNVINWTSVAAASSATITVPGTHNAIVNIDNDTEVKQLLVETDSGLSTQTTNASIWRVKNNRTFEPVANFEDSLRIEPYFPITDAELNAGVEPVNFQHGPGIFERYGDTSEDATNTIIAACKVAGVVARPAWPFSNYNIGSVTIDANQRPDLDLRNTFFTLVGAGAGFYFHGTIHRLRITGGEYRGDAVNRDAEPNGNQQIAIALGNVSGDAIDEGIIDSPRISDCNVGIMLAYAASTLRVVSRVIIRDPNIDNMIGYSGGRGYGIQCTQAPGAQISGGSVRGCQRHGLYFSEGEDYRASDIEISGCGKNDGTLRGAVAISRSRNVVVSNLHVHDNLDVGMVVDVDSQGITPKEAKNVQINGCLWEGNVYGDLLIGTSADPATDGVPSGVHVNGGTMVVPAVAGAAPLVVKSAYGLTVHDLVIDARANTSGNTKLVSLTAIGGATYTDDVLFDGLRMLGGANTAYGYEVAAALCTGTVSVQMLDTKYRDVPSEFSFGAAITNSSLVYVHASGKAHLSYTSSGTGITIAIPTGVPVFLYMTPSGATTVETFSGGAEGQTVVVHSGNTDTTIKNTTIYTPAEANIVMGAHDVAQFLYSSAGWRTISYSDNDV